MDARTIVVPGEYISGTTRGEAVELLAHPLEIEAELGNDVRAGELPAALLAN